MYQFVIIIGTVLGRKLSEYDADDEDKQAGLVLFTVIIYCIFAIVLAILVGYCVWNMYKTYRDSKKINYQVEPHPEKAKIEMT